MQGPEFKDAAEFFADPLKLPVRGKVYTIPEVDIEFGLLIARVVAGQKNELSGKPTVELFKRFLGAAWDEMVADEVPGAIITRAGETAMTDYLQGREIALLVWESGISPEALAAQKAATQKQESPTAKKTSQSSAAVTKTPSPASSSGTRSRPATRHATKAARAPKT